LNNNPFPSHFWI